MLRYIKRRRIKKVMKYMSGELVRSYGSREYFSLGQVRTVSRVLSSRQRRVALALYCAPSAVVAEQKVAQEVLNQLRSCIALDYFDNEDYTAMDVLNVSKARGWHGGKMEDYLSHHRGMNSRY